MRPPTVDGGDQADAGSSQPCPGQRGLEQACDLLGCRLGRATDPDDERGWVQEHGPRFEGAGGIGDHDPLGARPRRERRWSVPTGDGDLDEGEPTGEHRRSDAGDVPKRAEPREIVERGRAAGVGRRRDDGLRSEQRRHLAGDGVGSATVASAQGHDVPTGLVDADDTRVVLLGREQRGDHPHRCTGRHHQHQRVDLAPQPPDRVTEGTVDRLVGKARRSSAPCFGHRDGDHPHGSGPQTTKTGWCASRRNPPSASRSPRATVTCTRLPSSASAAAARSIAA